MEDILYRAKFSREKKILAQDKDGDLAQGFAFDISRKNQGDEILYFKIDFYKERLKDIGEYLSIIKKRES